MMKYLKSGGSLARWGQLVILSAPLALSCAQSSANSNPVESSDMVASNDSKEAEAADMKKVILHVFGMT
jgi:hypothetical protein